MQDKLQGVEGRTAGTERRAGMRVRAPSLLYVDLGNSNGGIATWINENGLALTSAVTLDGGGYEDELLRMRIHLPGHPEGIEAAGQIVWRNASGKEAGIRFVDLSAVAQQQIRSWISSQVSKAVLWSDQRELPKMALPTAKPAKPHSPRFSFADVASSRVGAEDESRSGDFSKADIEATGWPSPSVKHGSFADVTQAVASAFESPVFSDELKEKAPSTWEQQPPPSAVDEERRGGPPPRSVSERRASARREVLLFTYAVLDEDNGGLVFNLSEGGLALTAAALLRDDHFDKIRVRFPDSEDWIDAKGRLAWISDSGKEGGIEFVGLPEGARIRIREWVSQGESAVFQPQESEARTSPYSEREAPSFIGQEQEEVAAGGPSKLPSPFAEPPKIPADPPRGALFASGIKGVFARASVRRQVARIKPPRRPEPSVRPHPRIVPTALASAALFTLLAAGWIFLHRGRWNVASGNIPQIVRNTPISSDSKQRNAVAETNTVADLPIQAIQNAPSQHEITNTATPSTGSGADLGPKEIVPSDNTLGNQSEGDSPTANRAAHGRDSAKRKIAATRELKPQRQQSPSPLPPRPPESKPLENRPAASQVAESKASESVQTAEALAIQNKNLIAAAPASSPPPLPPDAAPASNVEKEKPLPTPKQPEAVVTRTPLVTVSFDAFPSIRMPKVENPKKSRQGKSLQMGHLVSRVDPVYPEQAKQQGIEGTVKVHAIFGRGGTVESLTLVSGPPSLVSSAMNAVRQWRYSQTILGGQAMETEEDVTVLFQLSNGISRN